MITSSAITQFQISRLGNPDWPHGIADYTEGVWHWIETNHRFNCMLWAEEDLARRTDVADSDIAKNKRSIDTFNQRRNDATEKIDEHLLSSLATVKANPHARLNSETAGSMIDRLSILSLKLTAMRHQTERTDVSEQHRATCSQKLALLQLQHADLSGCFDRLLLEASQGESVFKVYRQFKMYNDPTLNPALYGAPRG
jgi:hypothetical protein